MPTPITFADCLVEISNDGGGTWTDISDYVTSVTVDGGNRDTGEAFTYGVQTPMTAVGHLRAVTLTLRCIFTSDASDPHETLETAKNDKSDIMVRFTPAGGSPGDRRWTTASDCKVVSCPPATAEAASVEPAPYEAQFYTPSLTSDVVI